MKTNLLLLLAWIVLAQGSAWAAEDASPQPAVETRELVIWPAREPAVGTFELSYAPDELRAGNAAIDLYKAILLAQNLKLDSEQLDPLRLNVDERQAKLAALATIEAVRRYAAAHDGQLPAKLDELPDGVWLRDPFTGEPFPYTVKDDHAVLTVPLVGQTSSSSQLARQYVLRRGK